MANQDSDDYELMPSHELDDLRHEVSLLKKGSLTDGDKARMLIESMDRLTISINRMITILDDAQKDIIDEYQASKPAEKLNQILEQNEMIAKALVAMHDNMTGMTTSSNDSSPATNASPIDAPAVKSYSQGAQGSTMNALSQAASQSPQAIPGLLSMPSQNAPVSNPRSMFPTNTQQQNMPPMNSLPPLNMPPIGNYPSMNNNMPPMNQGQAFGQQSSMGMQYPGQFNNQMPMGPPMSMSPPPMSAMDDLPPMDEIPPLDAGARPKKNFLGL